MNNLEKLTAHEASRLLIDKEISSVELTEAVLARIQKVDNDVKAYVTISEEFAMQQAREADDLISSGDTFPLTGVPFLLKDNMVTKGIRTTCSSRMLEDFVPPFDGAMSERMKRQGAVLLGKGNLDEFAMGSSNENSAFFTTRNPWDLSKVPGGSSGGPSAATAADECIFALGSDTGGSIRQPAALCGVVGLKPTYGLVSRYGLVAFASSLDQIGPITKDVADNALVLGAIAGRDFRDSTSLDYEVPDYSKCLHTNLSGLKIGVPKEYFVSEMEIGVQEATMESIKVLRELGAEVEEVSLPSTAFSLAVYYIIAPSEASANLARYDGVKYGLSSLDSDTMWEALEKTRQMGFGDEVKRRIMLGTYALSAGYYDAYYLKAQKVRTIIREEFNSIFKDYNALVMPTSPTVAFSIGERLSNPVQMYSSDILTMPANIAGIPGISVPGGFSNGLPIGLQIMGPALGEGTILRIAYAYEQATEWHLVRPKL